MGGQTDRQTDERGREGGRREGGRERERERERGQIEHCTGARPSKEANKILSIKVISHEIFSFFFFFFLFCCNATEYVSVLWLDIQCFDGNRRITALGCQDGYVKVAVVQMSDEPS